MRLENAAGLFPARPKLLHFRWGLMQVRTGRAGGVSGGPATSTRVGHLLLDG